MLRFASALNERSLHIIKISYNPLKMLGCLNPTIGLSLIFNFGFKQPHFLECRSQFKICAFAYTISIFFYHPVYINKLHKIFSHTEVMRISVIAALV